eukprot:7380162-Prymnesium_polylepis.1
MSCLRKHPKDHQPLALAPYFRRQALGALGVRYVYAYFFPGPGDETGANPEKAAVEQCVEQAAARMPGAFVGDGEADAASLSQQHISPEEAPLLVSAPGEAASQFSLLALRDQLGAMIRNTLAH